MKISGKRLTLLWLQVRTGCFHIVSMMLGCCNCSGHDTTATNMSFTLYLLAVHPEIQQRCQVELDTIFGEDRERPATSQDINKMKYLELCLKEALR